MSVFRGDKKSFSLERKWWMPESDVTLLDLAILSKMVYGEFNADELPVDALHLSHLWHALPETSTNLLVFPDTMSLKDNKGKSKGRLGFYACVYEHKWSEEVSSL